MAGRAIQIQRETPYPNSKRERWVLVYPPQEYASIRQKGHDIPEGITRKEDLYAIMRMNLLDSAPAWRGMVFKVLHMQGGQGRGFKVIWLGRVWADGRVALVRWKKTGRTIDLLGEPPFNLK